MAESIFDNLTSPAFTTAVPLSAAVMPTGDAPAGAGKASRRAAAKAFKARLRRSAQLRTAADALPHLPGPGESLHALLTGSYDFALLLACVIRSRPSRCDHLRITTLAFSRRNVQELSKLLDENLVGRLTLLCSDFHAKSNRDLFAGAVEELVTARGQTVASSRCHAKVTTMAFADGTRLSFEGSANLRTNKNLEQVCVVNDESLHDWHAVWIDKEASPRG